MMLPYMPLIIVGPGMILVLYLVQEFYLEEEVRHPKTFEIIEV